MKPLTIVAANLRRLMRTPYNLFFIGLGPLAMIFLLGSAFGSSATTHVDALAPHSKYADHLLETISHQQGLTVQRVGGMRALREAIEYGDVEAGIVVPPNYDQLLLANQNVQIRYYAQQGINGQQVNQIVQSGVTEESNEVVATRLLQRVRGMTFGAGFARVQRTATRLPKVTVNTVEPIGKRFPRALKRFTSEASSQLFLFVFIISLMNSAALIETRRLGIASRMLVSPTTVRSVILGEALGRFVLAAIQAVLIVLLSWSLFGVEWGNGLAVAAVTIAFCLVAAGFAMLLGSTLATEQQALAVALFLGAGLAAIGGSMVPLIFFPTIMRDLSHIAPHAWGNEAMIKLLKEGGGLVDVLPQVGALIGFAVVTFSLAVWLLRHELTH